MEWTESNVQPLLDKYNAYLTSIGKSYQITLQGGAPTIKGYLTQGAIVIANDVWGKLRDFVQWIQSEYALTDNQTGVELSRLPDNTSYVPFVPAENVIPKISVLQTSENIFFGIRGGNTSLPRVKVCIGYASNSQGEAQLIFGVVSNDSYPGVVTEYKPIRNNYGTIIDTENVTIAMQWGGLTLRNSNYPSVAYFVLGGIAYVNAVSFGAVPSFDTVADTMEFLGGQLAEESAVTVDTTTVSPLEPLPADTPWGGLVVEGAGDVASPSVVEEVVAEAIEQREKPVVQPVTITVPPNTEIDPETGQTDPPIVITPFPILSPTGLELGEELLDALETHFPFSVPWDLYNIFVHLDAQPVAPRFTLTTPALSSGLASLTLTIDVATTPFDSFAPVFRTFTGILLAIGMLIGASRWIKR